MRFNNVLFINPAYPSTIFTTPVIPAGIGYIAEYLKTKGINYSVVDMALGYNLNDLKKIILRFKPDLIGISMMSIMYKSHYAVAEFIKSSFPEVPIIAGGPHVSSCRESVLKECNAIDFGVLMEGEVVLSYLCEGRELYDIPGLLFRKNGEILCSGVGYEVEDLDTIPFPKYENFELDKYGFGISIVSSRGCPFRCIYCSAHAIRKKFRARSPVNIVDEMEYWYKRGYREYDFQEDNPTFNKSRLFELCNEIEMRELKDIIIMCGNGIRADKVDRQLLKRMKDVGFKRLAFGVEGGNDKVLRNIKKGEKIEVVKNAIRESCDLDFFVSLFFVVGSPGETPLDVEDSIKIALSYPISHVNFFNLIPLPNTELYKWVEKNNYFILKPDVYLNLGASLQMSCSPVFETPEFPAKERSKALKRVKKIERIIKRRAIEKKLMTVYPLNKLIGWIYTLYWVQRLENSLTRYAIYRKTIGLVRAKIRLTFYK